MGQKAIETENLTKIFGDRLIAVNNASFTVEEGAVFGFLGPNGAGKTTVIRLLLGLIRPTAGEARLFGERVTPGSSRLRGRVGYLPTNPRFPPRMTPIQYLDFVGRLFNLGAEERTKRLSDLLRSAGLLGDASREIAGFSTGMTTRLGLAAALMNDPELLILDEPTSGLDPAGRRSTLELIAELGKEKTVLVSSHILSDIDRICSDVGVISDGKSIFCGPMRELKKRTRSHVVRLEVEGGAGRLAEALKGRKWAAGVETRGDYGVDITFAPDASLADVAREATSLVASLGLNLVSLDSSTSSIEDAFMGLLQDEESRGFLRAA
jgi:ABC-2 type transport system ATP-binding protein